MLFCNKECREEQYDLVQNLLARNSELYREAAKLRAEIRSLEDGQKELIQDCDQLEQERDQLKKENIRLNVSNEAARKKLHAQLGEITHLQLERNELEQERDQLQKENEMLEQLLEMLLLPIVLGAVEAAAEAEGGRC